MTRKLTAWLLVISLLLCTFSGCASNNEKVAKTTTTIQMDGYEITVEEDSDMIVATTTFEGVPMKCERNIGTEEYLLYIDENDPIQLEVEVLDDNLITIAEVGENKFITDDEVIGQSTLTLALAAPAFITAAEALICATAGVAFTASVLVLADTVGNVIGGIRSSSKTYSKYKVVSATAATSIRLGRAKKYNAYYRATLENNKVYIGKEISFWGAVALLEQGYDVFATSAYAAASACAMASTKKRQVTWHQDKREGYYPHYHPAGRRWVKNRNLSPHCWYPY